MRVRFGDANPAATTRTKISKLKQGGKSVQLYSSMFNEHAGQTGYNDKALINIYLRGLNENILQGVFTREKIPTSLEDAINAATREENISYRFTNFLGSRKELGATMP